MHKTKPNWNIIRMYKFTETAKDKGWRMVDLARRWGVTPRQMSRIAANPDQRDWDALSGLIAHHTDAPHSRR